MFKKILAWLTTVFMFFAGLFGFRPKPPESIYPTQADYVEVLEALKDAFATGEYQAFVGKYPRDRDFAMGDFGDCKSNEWPALLEGLTAEMTYDIDDFNFLESYCFAGNVTVEVANGNTHLPSGRQIIFVRIMQTENFAKNNLMLYSMSFNTDGREEASQSQLEEQIRYLSFCFVVDHSPLLKLLSYFSVLDPTNFSDFTEAEIIAGAKKYLGIDYALENLIEDRKDYRIAYYDRNGVTMYGYPGMCGPNYRASTLILNTPTQGDITCRAFIYANSFLLDIAETSDYNFLILHEPDGTPYAQLLSVTTVN